MCGIDDEPQKGQALAHRAWVRAGVDRQPQPGHPLDDGVAPGPQGPLVVGEQHEIVYIAHSSPAAQLPPAKVVERVEVAVGPKLAGQVANGQSSRAKGSQEALSRACRGVVGGEPGHFVLFTQHTLPALQDAIHQPQHVGICQLAGQDAAQDGVVDGGKELPHIALEDVPVPARICLRPIQRPVRAFSDAIGVAVMDKAPLKDRLDGIAQRVMHHPVAKGRRRDQPPLRCVDGETAVRPGPVSLADQFLVQCFIHGIDPIASSHLVWIAPDSSTAS